MSAMNISPSSPFITDCSLQPLPDAPDISLLDVRYDVAHFSESLFNRLNIPTPVHLQRAVKKRRAEYLASRYCLQQALASWGITDFVLSNGPDRAPLWPEGINGSLSHTHQQICALLTQRQDVIPGVDCETIMSEEMASETWKMLIGVGEKQRLAQSEVPFATALTVAFSVKESLYKALYPQIKQFMDFSAAEIVACSADLQSLRLRLTQTFSPIMTVGRIFEGRALLHADRVMTWVTASSSTEN